MLLERSLRVYQLKMTQSISDHKIKIDGLNVYFQTAGDFKNQHLVFLHGWAARKDSKYLFVGNDRVIREFAKNFYVIAPEHPGAIRSEVPKDFVSYKQYASLLNKVLVKEGIHKAIFIGQSWGAGLA